MADKVCALHFVFTLLDVILVTAQGHRPNALIVFPAIGGLAYHYPLAAWVFIQRVLVIGSQLGARVGPSELLKMQWCDIDLQRRLVRIRGANKNKNAPWREVPIREELIPVFEEWKAQDRQVGLGFLIHYKGKPIESIQTTWKATLRRAGISRRIRPYDLRHAFATELIAGGTDIGTVASLMGHSTPSMLLKHYQFVMDRQKRAAVETLPSMGLYATACMQ